MKKGKFVQDFTRRGSPRQGHNKYKWRSNCERRQQIFAAIVIAVVMILVVIMPAIFSV